MTQAPTALYSAQDALPADAAQRNRCPLLKEYAQERAARWKARLVLFAIGCFIASFALDPRIVAIAFLLAVGGDWLDSHILRTHVRRLIDAGRLRPAQRLAVISSAIQGGAFVASIAVFYFAELEEADLLFVVGALCIGAVNATIALPKNPATAICRLFFYASAPFVLMGVHALQLGSFEPFYLIRASSVMLMFCLCYMFIAFSKAGLENARITQDLRQQRAEMKAVTARLQEQQTEMRQLSLVARNANDCVIISDKNRHIVWVNDAFTRITGFSLAEAKGQAIVDLLTGNIEELRSYKPIEDAVAAGRAFRGELQNVTKDGRRIWVDVNLFPIRDEAGEVEFFVSIERDVTEARQLAQDMVTAREAAEQGARTKAEFLANMSHEIRTPLSGVIGMADLLAETQLDTEQARFTETIRGSSMSLMAIINDILDLSKLDAGRMQLHPVVFSPHACIKETLDLLSPAADDKGLVITFNVGESTPDYVKADDGRIRQVLTNILGNAIKFTDTGGVDVMLRHTCDANGRRLICKVSDTGIGIPKDQQDKIFDHFTQAEAATSRKFGGTGLGLSITRHILDVMGGSIMVESEPGEGATFCVEIPYEDVEQSELSPMQAANTDVPAQIEPGLRILVAEDNQTNRFLMKKYLKDQPLELAFAEDGQEAVEMVEGFAPNLIFMDMSMPRLNGVEATKAIRKMAIAQPTIVALTAHAFDGEMQACLDAGMDEFLTKPLRKVQLLNWIADHQKNGQITGAA
ncbi:ATP-binding protein [Shimia sp.]|uniref:ATP-binding protein n=1 Tax=Shimia sp. TaxID=1954381 RepID=UPI003BA8C5D6